MNAIHSSQQSEAAETKRGEVRKQLEQSVDDMMRFYFGLDDKEKGAWSALLLALIWLGAWHLHAPERVEARKGRQNIVPVKALIRLTIAELMNADREALIIHDHWV